MLVARLVKAVDRLAYAGALFAGALFSATAVFLVLDVSSRKLLGKTSGVADEYSGYALLTGGLFALAYTLRRGQFVRIDVLLPYMPPRLRTVLNFAALALMALFALLFGVLSLRLALESYEMGARAASFSATALFIPQGLMALGFCMLALQSAAMLLDTDQWHAEAIASAERAEQNTQ